MAAVTLLGSGTFNTTSGTKTVTAIPAVGDLIVIITAHTGNTSSAAPTDDNNSGTYTEVTGAASVKATSADQMRVWVRNALIPAATSTVFTHAPGTSSGGGLIVLKVTGMSRVGSAAVVKSGKQDNQASGTPAPSLGSAASSSNCLIGAVFSATNSTTTQTPPASWTERFDNGYNTPATGLEVATRDSGETNTTITWGGASGSAFCSSVVELNASFVPTDDDTNDGWVDVAKKYSTAALIAVTTAVTPAQVYNAGAWNHQDPVVAQPATNTLEGGSGQDTFVVKQGPTYTKWYVDDPVPPQFFHEDDGTWVYVLPKEQPKVQLFQEQDDLPVYVASFTPDEDYPWGLTPQTQVVPTLTVWNLPDEFPTPVYTLGVEPSSDSTPIIKDTTKIFKWNHSEDDYLPYQAPLELNVEDEYFWLDTLTRITWKNPLVAPPWYYQDEVTSLSVYYYMQESVPGNNVVIKPEAKIIRNYQADDLPQYVPFAYEEDVGLQPFVNSDSSDFIVWAEDEVLPISFTYEEQFWTPFKSLEPQFKGKVWHDVDSVLGVSTTWTINPSGGITFSGNTTFIKARVIDVSGGINFSGTSDYLHLKTYAPAGGITFSGNPLIIKTNVYDITGNITFSGTGGMVFAPAGTVPQPRLPLVNAGIT